MTHEKDNISQLVPHTNEHYKRSKVANKITVDVFGVYDSYTFSVNTQNNSHPCILLNIHH